MIQPSATCSLQWCWRFNRTKYDCTPQLSVDELLALDILLDYIAVRSSWPSHSHDSILTLKRVLAPIEDILANVQCPIETFPLVKRLFLQEMQRHQTSFWCWSSEHWYDIIGASCRDFSQRNPSVRSEARLYVAAIGYLLCCIDDVDELKGISFSYLAKKVFGVTIVEESVQAAIRSLEELKFSRGHCEQAEGIISYVLLKNRSPLLTDISFELLENLRDLNLDSYKRRVLVTLSRGLVHMGILAQPLEHLKGGSRFARMAKKKYLSPVSIEKFDICAADGQRQWLFDLAAYDRNPQLTAAELATLTVMVERFDTNIIQWKGEWRITLKRLLTPLLDVLNRHKTNNRNTGNVNVLWREMLNRRTSFWAWSTDTWLEIIGANKQEFHQRYPNTRASRSSIIAISYALCGLDEMEILSTVDHCLLAKRAFGALRLEEAIQLVLSQAEDLGYSPTHLRGLKNFLCFAFICNRSLTFSDITLELLTKLQKAPIRVYLKEYIMLLSRTLAALGVLPQALRAYIPKDWEYLPYDESHFTNQQEKSEQLRTPPREKYPVNSSVATNTIATNLSSSSSPWRWPLDITLYDRTYQLNDAERVELERMIDRYSRGILPWLNESRRILQRLLHPIYDALFVMETNTRYYSGIAHILLEEMHRRQVSFWSWSKEEWLETIGQHEGDFLLRHVAQGKIVFRQFIAAIGYLLCDFRSYILIDRMSPYPLACKVFSTPQVDHVALLVHQTLEKWGYAPARYNNIKKSLCVVLLSNRSPILSDISLALLEELQSSQMQHYLKYDLVLISLALVNLGILTVPLKRQSSLKQIIEEKIGTSSIDERTDEHRDNKRAKHSQAVDTEWLAWCQRWRNTSALEPKTRTSIYYSMLQAGRWLFHTHPEVNTPEGWNRVLAAEYVGAVTHMTVGEWSRPSTLPTEKIGKPITPNQQAHHLSSIRTFFRECQEWEWIPVMFDPRRSFATPRSVLAKIGPNPRVIADDIWAKLLAAGLSVTVQDFINSGKPQSHRSGPAYPIEMLRALVIVWLFSGLRSDEICRLRVGCTHWSQANRNEKTSVNPDAEAASHICLLDIPVNKTKTAFTKPVDLVVGEAIAAWERVRPTQPAMYDAKTGEKVHYLFAFRLSRVARSYINEIIIPVLCQKAGVPRSDARGNITSHRARSTIASQLANAKEPMTLLELQQWLGHNSPDSTRNYLITSPTKLAQAYADADYFKRNLRTIEVLVDQDAIKSGAASQGEPWRYYDLGHGYCTYDFFDQCPHRMACAKCSFYRPKGSSQAQILEAKANLLRMKQDIPLSNEEKAAVDDGLTALEALCEQLADVPTPAGPTPRELASVGKRMLPMAVLPVDSQK